MRSTRRSFMQAAAAVSGMLLAPFKLSASQPAPAPATPCECEPTIELTPCDCVVDPDGYWVYLLPFDGPTFAAPRTGDAPPSTGWTLVE